MALIVETGAGIASANSYISQSSFETYCELHGYSITGKTDDQIEAAIIRATSWLDNTYRSRWPGVRTYGSAQSLMWPRKAGTIINGVFVQNTYLTTVTDAEGLPIAINVIPSQIIAADAEAAFRELNDPGSLAPDADRGGAIKSLAAGSVNITYADSAPWQTTFTIIDSLLAGLLGASDRNAYTGRAVRG